jgi:hypothetical protein
VNSHLRNAFAKLGIRSRTELGRFINAHHDPVVDEPWPNLALPSRLTRCGA